MFEEFFRVATSSVAARSTQVIDVFKAAWDAGKPAATAIKELKDQGISYRRQNMLDDYRRAGALTRVKEGNLQGIVKANKYYDTVFEPFRKANNLTAQKAWDQIHAWENGQYKTVEEAKRIEDQNIQYGFDTSP